MKWVSQVIAKRGDFIDSYETREAFVIACQRLDRVVKAKKVRRELVYTTMLFEHKTMWQIYLLP